MALSFLQDKLIDEVVKEILKAVSSAIRIRYIDSERPWGGFICIEEEDIEVFLYQYFPQIERKDLGTGKLSPKILLVAPGKRLSWQYHNRRSEMWKIIGGQVGVITSNSDEEGEKQILKTGEVIKLQKRERHRLIGLQEWGIVAEIWMHTDNDNPSDEEDIIRLQDDFGR
jgi:mannose-6-phosphate isomerase-like protein (cupin superfamily)